MINAICNIIFIIVGIFLITALAFDFVSKYRERKRTKHIGKIIASYAYLNNIDYKAFGKGFCLKIGRCPKCGTDCIQSIGPSKTN
jgi:hypothetical protein